MKKINQNEVIKNINKSGISLITLVVTIIIIIILAAAVILTFSKNNPIDQANKAKFIQDVSSFKDELNLWIANEYAKTLGEFDSTTVDATKVFGTYKDLKMQEIIKSMPNKYTDIFEIQEGKLVYIGTDKEKEKWAKENEIEKGNALVPPYTEAEITNMIQMQGYIPVASATELNNVRYTVQNTFGVGTIWEGQYTAGLDKKYIQVKDVDLSIYAIGTGWTPIGGNDEDSFSGIYNGNSNDIKNLYIDNNEIQYAGVFGVLEGNNQELKNIIINNVNINNTKSTGVLAALLDNTTCLIENVKTNGKILNANGVAGGLIGFINYEGNIINKCNSKVIIKSTDAAGGLIGYNEGNIENCYATGNVETTSSEAGGLIGISVSNQNIKNCYATGNVIGARASGGLIGQNYSNIENCYATGNVESSMSEVGGLIGINYSDEIIKNSYAIGDVKGTRDVGGLIGYNESDIENCYATGNIIGYGVGNDLIGGLLGMNKKKVSNSYATGNVKGDERVGGLIGASFDDDIEDINIVTNCYATGNIESSFSNAGGLIGYTTSIVNNSYATGNVNGKDYVGGLIGFNYRELNNCYASGIIIGENNVGGLTGQSNYPINDCYSIGSVKGIDYVGGIVGYNNSLIKSSYATGNTEGNNSVGGIVGRSTGGINIENSYTIGNVSGNNNIGGLGGECYSTINLCYVKNDVLGNSNVGGLVGQVGGTNIFKSYAIGKVSGIDNIGGIVGFGGGSTITNCYSKKSIIATGGFLGGTIGFWAGDNITNCYTVNNILGENNIGGIIGGPNESGPPSTSTYWNTSISNILTSAGGTDVKGKTTEEMKHQLTYTNWDFSTIWNISSSKNDGYPYIKELESTL